MGREKRVVFWCPGCEKDVVGKKYTVTCLACGSKRKVCRVCYEGFRGCSDGCIRKAVQEMDRIMGEKIKPPGLQKKDLGPLFEKGSDR